MGIRDKKMFGVPLTAILVFGLVFAGGVIASWYWSSEPFTFTISVSGQILAKTVNTTPGRTTPTISFADHPSIGTFYGTNPARVDLIVGQTNTLDLTLKLDVTAPTGVIITCTAELVHVNGAGGLVADKASWAVPTDGMPIDLECLGDPLWLAGGWGEAVRYCRLAFTFDTSGATLGIGDHDISVVMSFGDTL